MPVRRMGSEVHIGRLPDLWAEVNEARSEEAITAARALPPCTLALSVTGARPSETCRRRLHPTEIPALIANPNVTSMTQIDLVTGKAKRVWPYTLGTSVWTP